MKRTAIASALAASLFVTTIASAETDNALFPSNNAYAQVTFYGTDPADGVPLATAMVNNSPFAATIDGVEAAQYVVIEHDEESYTFALSESGTNKNDVWLDLVEGDEGATLVSDTSTMSLTALMDGLSVNPDLLEEIQRDTTKG